MNLQLFYIEGELNRNLITLNFGRSNQKYELTISINTTKEILKDNLMKIYEKMKTSNVFD